MALHPNFPADPYQPLIPGERWFPAAEELRATAYEKLLPPLVAKIRAESATGHGTSPPWKGRSGNTGTPVLSYTFHKPIFMEIRP
jgi:hypothetical protein